ncbi:craniofacial development protein 2-like [Biomphalaria glabrata]|uniref:Craniofacial development protein 2-like n=1 Tax=Biomphalaria glabrata TaxID=6526 RepID=A0A9W3B711_BIOGL|nr:craniofacial development protein 2-like [Biomphalaria glabrata]
MTSPKRVDKRIPLRVTCLNVRTLQDSNENECPQRKSALVALELARLDEVIAALSELRLPLDGSRYVTIISAYASTLPAEPETKERFYNDLRRVLCKVNTTDKLIIMGDCNARVGNDYSAWPGVLGRHGNCNDNGRLLLELCSEAKLAITNTFFQQKSSFKTTWMHPRSKHWHLLDYIIVRQWNVRDVTHTRVMPSADCYTDHRLVRTKLNITIKMVKKDGLPRAKKLNVERLADVRERFSVLLEANL